MPAACQPNSAPCCRWRDATWPAEQRWRAAAGVRPETMQHWPVTCCTHRRRQPQRIADPSGRQNVLSMTLACGAGSGSNSVCCRLLHFCSVQRNLLISWRTALLSGRCVPIDLSVQLGVAARRILKTLLACIRLFLVWQTRQLTHAFIREVNFCCEVSRKHLRKPVKRPQWYSLPHSIDKALVTDKCIYNSRTP